MVLRRLIFLLLLTPDENETNSNLFTYFATKQTEARQISLFGGRSQAGFLIWNSALNTHDLQFATYILPFFSFLSLKV